MNLVEIYLEGVISVKEYVPEWTNKVFVLVTGKWNCNGNKYTEQKLFSNLDWESLEEKGYYLG